MSDKPLNMRNRPLLTPVELDELQEAYRQRLESLLAVDQGVARIVNVLRNLGILENTVIIYTSDNGWYQGEHRIGFGKVWPYEAAVKVPLLIRGPAVTPGRVVTAPVANIDLAPTILEVAGGVPRRVMDGRSLVPMLQGQANWPTGSGTRHLLVERNQMGNAANLFWSIRRGKYVYTEYANGDRELYDLGVDSAQLASRHADPAYEQVRKGLAARLAKLKTCVGTACW